jgi:protein ImuB
VIGGSSSDEPAGAWAMSRGVRSRGDSDGPRIVCVHIPRFELRVAAGGSQDLLGRPLAIAPAGGGAMPVGEVSPSAQAQGVQAGMALGEALARCPQLELIPGDPIRVAQAWDQAARSLEGIGAQLELGQPGLAYFDGNGLQGLHGGERGVIAATGKALRRPPRIGVAPTRFCALAAALEARSRRARVIGEREARRYLAARPVSVLRYRPETEPLVAPLQRFGIDTLGALVKKLGASAIADRFGQPGTLARRLALGHDTPLQTRHVEDRLAESMGLVEANSGLLLERALGVLVDRLLARPERRGRTLRVLVLSARLVERGTWREEVVLREAIADARRIVLACSAPLRLLGAPAVALGLEVEQFGPPMSDQTTLLGGERAARDERRAKAVAQVQALAGPHALLRVLVVDPESRVPERRTLFTPWLG